MPVYILQSIYQLTDLIPLLTQDYIDNKMIHICKLHHGDINCFDYSQWLYFLGPNLSLVYVPDYFEQSIRNVLNQLIEHFQYDDDNDEEDDNNHLEVMMMCPGCGVPFPEQ